MISHVCMRKHTKNLELKCYIEMKSEVNVQGHHSLLAPLIPCKAQRKLVTSKYKYANLFTSEGIQINEENVN